MKTMNTIRIENLKSIAAAYKSQKSLADAIDCTPGYVNQLLLGTRSIGEKVAIKIEAQLRKPIGWLDIDRSVIKGETVNKEITKSINEPRLDYLPIDLVDLKLQAGVDGFAIDYTHQDTDNEPIFFRAEWFVKNGYKPAKLIACRIKGDSMEPRLYAGDIVIINTADIEPKDGRVYAVNYEGQLIVKRLVRDAGQWWLSSDNPDKAKHPNKLCADTYCLIIGLVVYRQSSEI